MSDTPAPAPPALEELICFSICSTNHAFNQFYRPLPDTTGLTCPHYLVMTLLWGEDRRSVREIGRALRLQSNTLTPLLKRLEALGFITRQREAEGERVVCISLTDAGRALRVKAAGNPARVAEACGLDTSEREELIVALRTLRTRLLSYSGRISSGNFPANDGN